jgi:hypothetical protein
MIRPQLAPVNRRLRQRTRLRRPSGPRKVDVDGPGTPESDLPRSIERGNLMVAETTLGELGRPTLDEMLELTILIAMRDPRRHAASRPAGYSRYLAARDAATIDDAALVTACVVALGGDRHDEAAAVLRAISKTASNSRRADVAA